MKVLILPSSYLPVLGGVQTVAHALARHLVQAGHATWVVTNRYPRTLPARETIDGVLVRRWHFLKPDLDQLRRRRLDLFLASLYFYPAALVRIARLMELFRPDVVNVHFPDAQIPLVLHLRRRFDFRLVVSLHGYDIERFTGEDTQPKERVENDSRALKILLNEADAVTACSHSLLTKAGRLVPSAVDKGTAVYNGIDPARFQNKMAYTRFQPYVLAFGRLTHGKGFDMLLEAFSQLEPGFRRVNLILAGEGPERSALQAQAERLGLDGRVYFFGKATPEEVVRLLNGCQFVVVPSRVEAFGIVALEALAAGKRVLATRVGGMAEFLTEICHLKPSLNCTNSTNGEGVPWHCEATAMLVQPSVAGLVGGLRKWLSPKSAAVAPASVDAQILEEYRWERVAQRYEQVLAGCELS
jgi:glycogen(starch) synthase